MGSAELAQPFLDHRCVAKESAIDCTVIDLKAAFSEHVLQMAIADRLAWILCRRRTISHASKCRPSTSSFDGYFIFSVMVFRVIGSLPDFRSVNVFGDRQDAVNQENFRQAASLPLRVPSRKSCNELLPSPPLANLVRNIPLRRNIQKHQDLMRSYGRASLSVSKSSWRHRS